MNIPIHPFSRSPFAVFLLLTVIVMTQTACSPSASWLPTRQEDLSKISVEPFSTSGSAILPGHHVNAALMLTSTVRDQLSAENRLQTDHNIHSLRLVGIIMSYQDETLMVQGELYDDDKFLVYSRVMRHLAPDDDWARGIELVAEQLLDELMSNMRALQRPIYSQYYPPSTVGYYYIGSDYLDSYSDDNYYGNWGWWRHHDHDDQPAPKPHWVSDAIFDKVPRSTKMPRLPDESTTQSEAANKSAASMVPRSHGSASSLDSNSSSSQSQSWSESRPTSDSNLPSHLEPPSSQNAPHTSKFSVPRRSNSSSTPISDPQPSGSSPASVSGGVGRIRVPAASLDSVPRSGSPSTSASSPISTNSSSALVAVPSSSGSSSSTAGRTSSASTTSMPSRESAPGRSYSPTPVAVPSSGRSSSTEVRTSSAIPISMPPRESAPSRSYSPAPVSPPSSSNKSSSPGGGVASKAVPGPNRREHEK